MPSMLTLPAPINSAACWRDRASPRRTSSTSTRVRRGTGTQPFSADSSACTSMSCASDSRRASSSRSASAGASRRRQDRQLGEHGVDLSADFIRVGSHCAAPPHRFVPLAAARLVGAPTASSPARVMAFLRYRIQTRDHRCRASRAVSSPASMVTACCVAVARPDGVGDGTNDRQVIARRRRGSGADRHRRAALLDVPCRLRSHREHIGVLVQRA